MAGMNTDTELLINAITHQNTMAINAVGLKLSAAELLFIFESIGQAFVKECATNIDRLFSIVAVLDYIGKQEADLPDRVVEEISDAMPDTIMGLPVMVIDDDVPLVFGDWGLYGR